MVSIRQMVQEAVGVTPDESEQLKAWNKSNEEDRKRAREGSTLASASTEFTRNAQEMGEKLQHMDMQAMMSAERINQFEDGEKAEQREASGLSL